MLITMEDIRAGGGWCRLVCAAFFARYGLDLKAFIRDGGIEPSYWAGTGRRPGHQDCAPGTIQI
ncbi:Uncharacterised protein [Serratia liquefaciens]|nr:Uncharacterised protein [Serratia liquefaciens]